MIRKALAIPILGMILAIGLFAQTARADTSFTDPDTGEVVTAPDGWTVLTDPDTGIQQALPTDFVAATVPELIDGDARMHEDGVAVPQFSLCSMDMEYVPAGCRFIFGWLSGGGIYSWTYGSIWASDQHERDWFNTNQYGAVPVYKVPLPGTVFNVHLQQKTYSWHENWGMYWPGLPDYFVDVYLDNAICGRLEASPILGNVHWHSAPVCVTSRQYIGW